jgi:hypothetical protein
MDTYSLSTSRKLFFLLQMSVWTAILTVAARVRPLPRALAIVGRCRPLRKSSPT